MIAFSQTLYHKIITLFILLFVIFAAIPSGTAQAELANDYEVRISDRNLRSLLKDQCNLTIGDLAKIKSFNNKGLILSDLSGLEYCTNLEEITINDARLENIDVLAKLPNLTSLNLKNNQIKDISALSKLTNLHELNLETNLVKDISPLANLNNLTNLNLADNQISNILPLQNMINLKSINLSNNQLTNISPLLVLHQNGGLRPGNVVHLENNNLNLGEGSEVYKCIQQLTNEKVIVRSEPQYRIQVKLNGRSIYMDVPPAIIQGRTLVPLRAIFEGLNASVAWDNRTKQITAKKGDTTIVLSVNNKVVRINGEIKILDVPATVINGRTLVPARFAAETLGKKVDWDENTRSVLINDVIH